QKLVYALLQHDDIDLISTSKGENRLRQKTGYTFESLDITNEREVGGAFAKHHPDVIINTAAMTNVDACESEKENCWKINVDAVAYLIHECEKHDTHLIHPSTDFIFDGENGPYKEDDTPNPQSYYAKSKYESEQLVQQSNIQWTIIRTIIIYGIVDGMSRSNVVLWAKDALENGKPINVVDDQFRAPTLAEDLAQGCMSAAIKGATGIYHISGKDIMSILELVYKVADFYGLDKSLITPISTSSLNQVARRPPKTGFILDKAYNELGYEPHSFTEGLEILTHQLKKDG
ncbi:MAG: SDR family oxidoreductase, partial [Bacteroidia bacterium]|nr:SDR family oxidoreductase [Bacteroidia bacterium]